MPSRIPESTKISNSISRGYERYILREHSRAPSKRKNVYASGFEQCVRKMVLYMTHGHKLEGFPVETLSRFMRGNDRERNVVIDLHRVGQYSRPRFSVVQEQQRFELKDRARRVFMSGRLDLRLAFTGSRAQPPVEIKDWFPTLTAKINTFEDVFKNPWTLKGGHQVLMYLYALKEPFGFLMLATPTLPKMIPVELKPNMDRVEAFMAKARKAMNFTRRRKVPAYIHDADECGRCAFYGKFCNPPLKSKVMRIITDPALEDLLERHRKLAPDASAFKEADAEIKKRFYGIKKAVVGKFLVEGAWWQKTVYNIPPRTKKRYKEVIDKGSFHLTVTKLK